MERSRNVHGTFRERSWNVHGTFKERSGNVRSARVPTWVGAAMYVQGVRTRCAYKPYAPVASRAWYLASVGYKQALTWYQYL